MARNYNEYDDLGVQFIYPRNWFVRTETLDKGTYTITVDSPEGSFWALAIMPKGEDLDNAAREIVKSMKAEYDELEETEVKRYVADMTLTGYEIDFFYLDLSSTAVALKFEDERRGYVIYWQTCERLSLNDEGNSRVDIFNAMTHTLISNLTGQEQDWGDDEDDVQFDKALSERELREEEDREFFRRKYENARLKEEEHKLRRSRGEEIDEDECDYYGRSGFDPEEVLDGFLRSSEKTSEKDGRDLDELENVRHYYDDYLQEDSDDEDAYGAEDVLDDIYDEDEVNDESDEE